MFAIIDTDQKKIKMRSEKEIDFLENYIPILVNSAIQKAYLDTLSNGNSVLESIDGTIYEIFPDGSRKVIKKIAEDIKIDINKKIVIG